MNRRTLLRAAFAAALAFAVPTQAAEPGTQKSALRGVTVAVTPIRMAADAKTWEFKVVLDTHSQDLSDDFTKSAVLIAPPDKRYAPIAWEGAPPGGHHREGVLRFAGISPVPTSVELRMQRPGEPEPRSFRWQLH